MDFVQKRKTYYKHFKGKGLDVGPFDKPFIEAVFAKDNAIKVDYVDLHTPEELKRIFNEIPDFNPVMADYVHDVSQQGFGFNATKYDFIILSHVLEHVMNPFFVVDEAIKKLKPGGILYIGLPDERFSEDNGRPLTHYDELLEIFDKKVKPIPDDKVVAYLSSPAISQVSWVKKQLKSGKKFTKKQLQNERERSFHVHVWNSGTALQHFSQFIIHRPYAKMVLVDLDVWENNGYETVMIFRKESPHKISKKLQAIKKLLPTP